MLCKPLLQTRFANDWSNIDAIACCDPGGFVFASALAMQVDVRLALVREAGRLPPPAWLSFPCTMIAKGCASVALATLR